MSTMLNVLVGVPSGGVWTEQFGMSLVGLMLYSTQRAEVKLQSKRCSCLSQSRETLAEAAIARGCSHLLFLDTDQTFPMDLLFRLLSREKAIVACNIATKSEPSMETALLQGNRRTEFSTGLEKVWRVGTGVMLIKTSVFKSLPKPWFPTGWDSEAQRTVGEDWMFCEALEKAGIPIWVDHDTSAMVGHEGTKIYRIDRYLEAFREKTSSAPGIMPQPVTNSGPAHT